MPERLGRFRAFPPTFAPMSKTIDTWLLDAFTDSAYSGNPAGVCLMDGLKDVAQMQRIAAELNQAETAFLLPDPADPQAFTIRYFTPVTEVDFCGHATFASARLLFATRGLTQVKFTTWQQLELLATATPDGRIQIRFPRYATSLVAPAPAVLAALGIAAAPAECRYSPDLNTLVLPLDSPAAVKAVRPDHAALMKADPALDGVIVTSQGDDGNNDIVSRCFFPWMGINEDPATGSAHSVLGPYWQQRLGRSQLRAWQASTRGGYLELDLTSNDDSMLVTSNALMVLAGQLYV